MAGEGSTWDRTIASMPRLVPDDGNLDWQDDAICNQTDPEAFYPEKNTTGEDAKRICHGCPVRVECLSDALFTGDEWGVWGGFTGNQRTPMRVRVNNGEDPDVVAAQAVANDKATTARVQAERVARRRARRASKEAA